MPLYESLLRPALFRLDPETAHNLAMGLIRTGAVRVPSVRDSRLEQTLFGLRFANPVGLAAGFDKNAVAVDHWDELGFGFVEIGTVTARPQAGNPRPRLFRLPADQALVNRMGFNNDGAAVIAGRLQASRAEVPLGVNIGKSKAASPAEAAADYRESYRRLSAVGDYFVVNVSSPNTPGLRALQEKSALSDILAALREENPLKPLFVKIAPDLSMGEIDDVIEVAATERLAGIVATNTTLSREGLMEPCPEAGGLSGKPLRSAANDVMRHLASSVPEAMALIGVGGIFTGEDLFERIASGAHLCQVYTGWIYGGPATVPRILKEFLERLDREGIASLEELRGSAAR